jgi:hypothetical protein
MIRFDRPFYIVFMLLGALVDLGAWAWLLLVSHDGPRTFLLVAVALLLLLWPYWTWRFLSTDLEAERGRAAQEWATGGYRYAQRRRLNRRGEPAVGPFAWETVRVWIDLDGDGEIDEGELVPGEPHIRVMGKDGTPDDLASQEAYRTRLRSLLLWCYRRQEECRGQRLQAGQIYGQGPGRVAFPGTYDEDMHALQRAGFIRGRSTGHVGKLVIPGAAAALEKFDAL